MGPLTSIAEDAAEAKVFARRTLAFYLPYLSPVPEFLGVEPELIARVQAASGNGDVEGAAALISDELLAEFALYGTPGEVVTKIEKMMRTAPISRIEFGMPHGPNGSLEAIHLLGKHVLPHFEETD